MAEFGINGYGNLLTRQPDEPYICMRSTCRIQDECSSHQEDSPPTRNWILLGLIWLQLPVVWQLLPAVYQLLNAAGVERTGES